MAVVSGAALLAHPYFADFNPTRGVYQAVIWLLAIWSALHLAIGVVMQLYCMARRVAGRMTAKYDMDIVNVALYWHFTLLTVAITVGISAGIPYLV
jgi:cytochrome c oxidase subunit I+III